jgi:hypothetical protein
LLSSTATDTPEGTVIGERPMRDISDHPLLGVGGRGSGGYQT